MELCAAYCSCSSPTMDIMVMIFQPSIGFFRQFIVNSPKKINKKIKTKLGQGLVRSRACNTLNNICLPVHQYAALSFCAQGSSSVWYAPGCSPLDHLRFVRNQEHELLFNSCRNVSRKAHGHVSASELLMMYNNCTQHLRRQTYR